MKFILLTLLSLLTPIMTFAANDVPNITVGELKAKMDRHERFVLLDIREPNEHAISRIPGSKLIPLGELPKRLKELNPNDEIVLHCKSGRRSAQALRILQKAGFKKVWNLQGGISEWTVHGKPAVP